MIHNIVKLIRAINVREVTFITPRKTGEIKRLETFLSRKLGSDFSEFYSYCDGFFDNKSYISMWTIEHIVSNDNPSKVSDNFTIIGDILMESDYIIADISDNGSSIKLLYEDRILSRNLEEFLENLILGKLDMFN